LRKELKVVKAINPLFGVAASKVKFATRHMIVDIDGAPCRTISQRVFG